MRCRSADDVVAALALARDEGLEVSVRGGGHNVAGRAVTDGGVMIDLAEMKAIAVDPERGTATAGGGVLWSELNDATGAHGLAVTGGAISSTGIAGLHARRRPRLADGQVRARGRQPHRRRAGDRGAARCSACPTRRHPDLMWALRGGGGNFGVATAFTYRVHPVAMVTGGLIAHPIDAAPELLRFYRDAVADVSDELTVFAGLVPAPDGSGNKLSALVICHAGEPEAAERELAPFKAFGSPLVTEVGPMPYPVINTHARRRLPQGVAQLLAVELHQRPLRRADRHRGRALRRRSRRR